MNKPQYSKDPIGHIDSLAKTLGKSQDHLVYIADKADSFYSLAKKIEKPDGSFRETYRVEKELKSIQKQVIKKIYYNVDFPHYLHGSIKDSNNPRSHVTAAETHINAKLLINIDISNFSLRYHQM